MMLETLARIESQTIQAVQDAREKSKRIRILETLQKVLISVFILVLGMLLQSIID